MQLFMRDRYRQWLVWIVLLLIFWTLALGTARQKTPTVDEPVHILRGYVLRQLGDLRQQFQHTPLSHRLIGSLLLTGSDLPDARQLQTWPTQDRPLMAAELLWDSRLEAEQLLFLARLPIIWLGMLLGALLIHWVGAWHGRLAANVVAILFTFSPNLLASGTLATTDFTAAATYLAAVFAWWHYWQRPSWGRWGLTAVCLGLAISAKLTGVLVLPITFVLSYGYWQRGQSWWRPGLIWVGMLPITAVTIWAVYGFEVGKPPGMGFVTLAPTYLYTWQEVLNHVSRGHEAFFLGQISADGWWHYFVVALLIKTPALTLMLLVAALVAFFVQWRRWRENAFMWLPPFIVLAAASYSRLNIGYRHILPALPFLLVAASSAAPILAKRRGSALLLGFGLLWYGVSGIWQQPDYLAYFNEFVGGSGQGYRYLSDSNLDWGQSLKELATYTKRREAPLFISYSGAGNPAYYGIEQSVHFDEVDDSFAPANPAPGHYALSTNHLQGLSQKRDLYDWFRAQTPVKKLGYSIFVYEVMVQAAGEWVGHCTLPAPLQSPDEAERLVGYNNLRHVYFDCEQTWVFPNNGRSGWYILPLHEDGWWIDQYLNDETSPLQLVYRFRDAPTYAVYYWGGSDDMMAQFEASSIQMATLSNGQRVSLPYRLGDKAEVMAYHRGDDAWGILWRAQAEAPLQLSIQAHLYGTGDMPQVADGLGYSSEQWQQGDYFVQRHLFAEQPATVRFLETKLYNYLTTDAMSDALRLLP